MQPYSGNAARCEKCGAGKTAGHPVHDFLPARARIGTVYCHAPACCLRGETVNVGGEHFHRICGNCGYEWIEAVLQGG